MTTQTPGQSAPAPGSDDSGRKDDAGSSDAAGSTEDRAAAGTKNEDAVGTKDEVAVGTKDEAASPDGAGTTGSVGTDEPVAASSGTPGSATSGSATSGSGTSGSGTSGSGTSGSGTSGSGTSDSGTSDSGTSDSGTSDSGTSDSGTSDSGTPRAGGSGEAVAADDAVTTDYAATTGAMTTGDVARSDGARNATATGSTRRYTPNAAAKATPNAAAKATPGATDDTRGPLDAEIARRAAATDIMVVATADIHGDRDVTVVDGPACAPRVLDSRHLAYPDTGADPVTASRSNLAEAPGVGLLLVASDGERCGVHLNGTARVVAADEVRRDYPDVPEDPVPGRTIEVWVVVEVGDAYLLDGDDVPAIAPLSAVTSAGAGAGVAGAAAGAAATGAAATGAPATGAPATGAPATGDADPDASTSTPDAAGPPPAASSGPARSGPDDSGDRGGRKVALVPVLVIIALLVVLVLAATAVGVAGLGRTPEASAPPPPPPAGAETGATPAGPPTLFGRVVAVNDPASLVVDVNGRPVPVSILGIDPSTIPGCAVPASLAFARTTLQGQEVTLVPDPTLPATTGGPTRAYAVLGTQLSYTDAAISAGHARAAGPSRYRAVFDEEQARARTDGVGMWGPPCVP